MIQQFESQLQIKGIKEGLLISIGALTYTQFLTLLTQELPTKKAFFAGSRVTIDVRHYNLNGRELAEIKTVLAQNGLELWSVLSEKESTRAAARQLELGTRLAGSHTDLNGNVLPQNNGPSTDLGQSKNRETENHLIIKETVRSGRSIVAEGSVVVIGDVNPGAQIVAGGDVVVWGRLRGLVHAGAHGNQAAVICALILNPTQLRIADQIAIAPDDRQTAVLPEQASIRNGQIVAQAWQ